MPRKPPSATPSKNERRLWTLAKHRAKKYGIPFDLRPEDVSIPIYCPALGLRLERNVGGRSAQAQSPSLDRINPKKGYVRGNVVVLSNKANSMKGSGTPEQLERVAAFVRQLIQ